MIGVMRTKASFMSHDHVSPSSCPARSVEQTTSMNRTVTTRRSPERVAARAFSARGVGAAAARRACLASSSAVLGRTDCPQYIQKRAPAASSARSFEQRTTRAFPQFAQKRADEGFSVWQLGHFIGGGFLD